MALIQLTLFVPAGVRMVEVTEVKARWMTPGGIQLGNRPVQFQLGIPDALLLRGLGTLIHQGRLGVVTQEQDDGTVAIERIPPETVFRLVDPPAAEAPPPPGPRIVAP